MGPSNLPKIPISLLPQKWYSVGKKHILPMSKMVTQLGYFLWLAVEFLPPRLRLLKVAPLVVPTHFDYLHLQQWIARLLC